MGGSYGYYYPNAAMPPYQPPNHDSDTALSTVEMSDSLPRRLRHELPKHASPMCDICVKDYASEIVEPSEEAENAVELPCGHCFGEFCIFLWVCGCSSMQFSGLWDRC